MPIIFSIKVYVGNIYSSQPFGIMITGKKIRLVSIIVLSILQFLYGLCIGTLWQKGAELFQIDTGDFKENQNTALILTQNQEIQQESQCIVCIAQCFVVIFGVIIGLDLFQLLEYYDATAYVSYEPRPKECIYDEDEELLDKKNDEKLPENFWDKKDFSIRKECLAYWNVFWKSFCKILRILD
nr:11995_t:CDS:2 [Entrophospora candida]